MKRFIISVLCVLVIGIGAAYADSPGTETDPSFTEAEYQRYQSAAHLASDFKDAEPDIRIQNISHDEMVRVLKNRIDDEPDAMNEIDQDERPYEYDAMNEIDQDETFEEGAPIK